MAHPTLNTMRLSLSKRLLLSVCALFFACMLAACPKPQRLPAPLPDVSIGVTRFTQPTAIVELMAGYLPKNQERVSEETMAGLDRAFGDMLRARTSRNYTYAPLLPRPDSAKSPTRVTMLDYWVSVGREAGVDYLLVPQIVNMHERDGGEYGVVRPAEILMDIYLVDVRNATLTARCNYEEKQVGLTDNLLTLPKFMERGGIWVTAGELAQEGMLKAIREFGL